MKTRIAVMIGMVAAVLSVHANLVVFSTDFENATQTANNTPVEHGGTVADGYTASAFTQGPGIGTYRIEKGVADNWFISDVATYRLPTDAPTAPQQTMEEAVTLGTYFEFTVTAPEATDFAKLKFSMRGIGSANTGYVTARSSVDNFASDLGTASGSMVTGGSHPIAVDLSSISGFTDLEEVTFRFYVYHEYTGGQANRRIGVDDIELSLAGPPPDPVYGTILEDDFSAGQGDWATRSSNPTNTVFTNGVVRISPNPANGQPGAAYLGFDTVTLLDGETLRLSVDVATDYAEPRNRDLRIALGLANPEIEGDSTNLAVPLNGYLTTMSSSGSTTDPRVSWIDAAGGTINFFNSSTSLVGDIPLDDSVSATNTLKTWVFDVARSGDDLVFTGSFDGTAFGGSVTATGAAVIANFKFNTLGLGYAYAQGQVATFDNVKLERFAASASGFAAWADSYGLVGDDALPGADPDGDGYDNLYEYALGGNPTNSADAGYLPEYGLAADGGTNWFEFVHARRKGAGDLDYYLELNTDLVYGTWTNAGYVVLDPPGDLDAEFEAVTNRVSTKDEAKQFVRLVVEQTP